MGKITLDVRIQLEYKSSMKVKTSITLSAEVLTLIDGEVEGDSRQNRSQLIEEAVRAFLKHKKRIWREAKDLRLINKQASRLNEEAEDALSYQVDG